MLSFAVVVAALAATTNAYWLMAAENFITTERMDPVVSPGKVSSHVHSVLGGSNFRLATNTSSLRESDCTSIPIPQDKSSYWFPHLYFQWNNGSFTSLDGGAVIIDCSTDYLFSDTPGTTTAFPDDFRMISGDPTLRTYNASSFAQQAVTFLCLDFSGTSTRHNSIPAQECPSGIRAQINFPSCWDGKNLDSPDHKSHVAFLSTGPDSGTCSDPNFPVTLPRIFMELYWASNDFDSVRSQAMNTSQPFVYSYGDPTGYGYHADFINGWEEGVLQKAVDNCHCNDFGDPTCCVDQGIFDMNKGQTCRITDTVDEQTTGTLAKLPGNNPVQPEGVKAAMFAPASTPAILSPVFAYTGSTPTQTGTIATPASGGSGATATGTTATTTDAAAGTSTTVTSTDAAGASTTAASTDAAGASTTATSTDATGTGTPATTDTSSAADTGSSAAASTTAAATTSSSTSASATDPSAPASSPTSGGAQTTTGNVDATGSGNTTTTGSGSTTPASGKTCSKKKRSISNQRRETPRDAKRRFQHRRMYSHDSHAN